METLQETSMEARLESSATLHSGAAWHRVCRLGELDDSWGEAALVEGRQVALFRVGERHVFAVNHADPATRANVMARGIVGSRGSIHTIASPLHKEVYSLSTGECFGNPGLRLGTYPVRVVGDAVEVAV
ncbi:nitrite reductase (NADH) small subunit [Arthrobacter silviterrae]|nr:nitrite reductase (NADH) small subunit [Arthrobacter silviterrae]